jgi:hypothetical protein
MAETTSREGAANACWNFPTKHLPPPLGSRDLREPLPLGKIVGASVIILATALGSEELVLCPYIVTQVGIGILWLAAVGFTMQFFLNMEIERYTLATGETAVQGEDATSIARRGCGCPRSVASCYSPNVGEAASSEVRSLRFTRLFD